MQTYEKYQKQPSSHTCTELSKTQFVPVSIVKTIIFQLFNVFSKIFTNLLLPINFNLQGTCIPSQSPKLTDLPVITTSKRLYLPNGSYSISDIQGYFEYILKKYGEKISNPSIRIYINKIENSITFKVKTGYYRELLTSETMKFFGSTKSKITKNGNGENVPNFDIT